MKKKILKIMGKVFLCFLILYLIYVIGNIIYANKIMNEFEIALNNDEFDTFKEYGMPSFEKEEESLKQFDYQKKRTYYLLGRLFFEYEITVANSSDVLENGVHLKELLNDFEERYIEERQNLKNIARKTGRYMDSDEKISFEFPSKSGEWYTAIKSLNYYYYYNNYNLIGNNNSGYFDSLCYPVYPTCFDEGSLYNLLETAALLDEKEYTGNITSTFTLRVRYNIFTHEFDGLASFCATKYGQDLLNEATYIFYNSDLSLTQELIRMHKKYEDELRVIIINDKIVSVYEVWDEYKGYEKYIENKFEKYILENNLSLDEAIAYLKSQGYKLGTSVVLKHAEQEEIELVFDGENLLWFDKINLDDEEKEKVNYLFENNASKTEIINELENMGYYVVDDM